MDGYYSIRAGLDDYPIGYHRDTGMAEAADMAGSPMGGDFAVPESVRSE